MQPILVRKATIANAQGHIIDWDSWEEATLAYNGGGDPDYLNKVECAFKTFKDWYK